MGFVPSLAIGKVPDARRQGVTTEGVSAILRREELPQATQQAVPYGGPGFVCGLTWFKKGPTTRQADTQTREWHFGPENFSY